MKCLHIREMIFDYIEGSLDKEITKEVEDHIKECDGCRNEVAELRKAAAFLEEKGKEIAVPEDFMSNIRQGLGAHIKPVKRHKKRVRTTFIAAAVLMLFIVTAFATDGFGIISFWRNQSAKESESIFKLIEKGYGEHVNLVDEDKNIRITIQSVVSDDINTLLMFKVEDLQGKVVYIPDFNDGVSAESNFKHRTPWDKYPIGGSMNLFTNEKYTSKGILTLLPVEGNSSKIKLTINRLNSISGEPALAKEGNWIFEIPVKKYDAYTYPINKEFDIEGNKLVVHEVTIAPTTTVLSYSYGRDPMIKKNGKHTSLKGVYDISILYDGKKYKEKLYGGTSHESGTGQMDKVTVQYDSMYLAKPDKLKVVVGSYRIVVADYKSIPLDLEKPFPQEFEYLGSKITIKDIKMQKEATIIEMSESMENRKYEMLDINVKCKNNPFAGIQEIWDGYIIGKDGDRITFKESFLLANDTMVEPKQYTTKRTIKIINRLSGEQLDKIIGEDPNYTKELIPYEIQIKGYQETIYVDKSFNINLK